MWGSPCGVARSRRRSSGEAPTDRGPWCVRADPGGGGPGANRVRRRYRSRPRYNRLSYRRAVTDQPVRCVLLLGAAAAAVRSCATVAAPPRAGRLRVGSSWAMRAAYDTLTGWSSARSSEPHDPAWRETWRCSAGSARTLRCAHLPPRCSRLGSYLGEYYTRQCSVVDDADRLHGRGLHTWLGRSFEAHAGVR